jgi:hypothetical protein
VADTEYEEDTYAKGFEAWMTEKKLKILTEHTEAKMATWFPQTVSGVFFPMDAGVASNAGRL